MVIAVPVAIGIALFISHYAPRRLASPLGYVVDLLAAVPSIVYGLWGALFLVPHMVGLTSWLNHYFGWIRVFHRPTRRRRPASLFTAGIVLAIMILPIITASAARSSGRCRRAHDEAALALGATRWEIIRMSVLPFGRSGHHQRLDARPGPRARRDDGGRHWCSPRSPVLTAAHPRPGRQHVRAEHRRRSSARPATSAGTR